MLTPRTWTPAASNCGSAASKPASSFVQVGVNAAMNVFGGLLPDFESAGGAGQERDGEGAQDESSSHDTLGGHGSSLYGVA